MEVPTLEKLEEEAKKLTRDQFCFTTVTHAEAILCLIGEIKSLRAWARELEGILNKKFAFITDEMCKIWEEFGKKDKSAGVDRAVDRGAADEAVYVLYAPLGESMYPFGAFRILADAVDMREKVKDSSIYEYRLRRR